MSGERFIFASFSILTLVKSFSSLLLVSVLLISCQDMYVVKGMTDVTYFKGRQVTLKVPTADGSWMTVDSCQVTHGEFTMKGHLDSVALATLFVDETPLIPIVLEAGMLNVRLSNMTGRVTGTRLNEALYAFFDEKNRLDVQVNELGHTESQMIMNGERLEDVHHYVDSVYTSITDAMHELVTGLNPLIRRYVIAANNEMSQQNLAAGNYP